MSTDKCINSSCDVFWSFLHTYACICLDLCKCVFKNLKCVVAQRQMSRWRVGLLAKSDPTQLRLGKEERRPLKIDVLTRCALGTQATSTGSVLQCVAVCSNAVTSAQCCACLHAASAGAYRPACASLHAYCCPSSPAHMHIGAIVNERVCISRSKMTVPLIFLCVYHNRSLFIACRPACALLPMEISTYIWRESDRERERERRIHTHIHSTAHAS